MPTTRTTRVDITQDQVEGLKINDQVRVTIAGVVKELEGERKLDFGDDESETFPPSIMVEISSTKVEAQSNEFATLAEDDG